jgi:hypothetical protein
VLLDIFSRYAVGWLLARQEAAALANGSSPGTTSSIVTAPSA